MGLIVDSNVLIHFERTGSPIEFSTQKASDGIFVSVVTVSEMLVGVHRADTDMRRQTRSAFVEKIISTLAALDFTTGVARVHAGIFAELQRQGQLIGAHDLIIAATAQYHGLAVVTKNVGEFSRVPGVEVIPFNPERTKTI